MSSTVCTRIAPSPTGDPHVGTAYVALFNYALAKKHGGRFVLRIEDTDRQRSNVESEEMIYEALRWLGLEWDEGPDKGGPQGPYRQSERSEIYREHVEQLVASGDAYPCFCTRERLEELRAHQKAEKLQFGYDGLCRSIPPEEAAARRAAGEEHVIRLAMPDRGDVTITDELRGPITFDWGQIDDQVLLKSDGFPTYHLANVVDDHLMGITHIIRAEEWISSLPKHVRLYEAFGWAPPVFCHLPLLRNADKSKISKRKNPVSLNHYRRAGYLPEAVLNYLALMGWTMPDERELFGLDEFVEAFTLDRISLGGPVFDVEKLTWLNGKVIRETGGRGSSRPTPRRSAQRRVPAAGAAAGPRARGHVAGFLLLRHVLLHRRRGVRREDPGEAGAQGPQRSPERENPPQAGGGRAGSAHAVGSRGRRGRPARFLRGQRTVAQGAVHADPGRGDRSDRDTAAVRHHGRAGQGSVPLPSAPGHRGRAQCEVRGLP
jgi:glutamyl-tRNA synthetase